MAESTHKNESTHKQAKICGANRHGKPGVLCRSVAVMPNGRCKIHGGYAPIGPRNGRYKDGRFSKYVPKRLNADYHASLNDPDKLDLSNQIAALDARFAELLRGLGTDPSDAGVGKLQSYWKRLLSAEQNGQDGTAAEMRVALSTGLARAARLEAVWHELYQVTERRRRLVESERKRLLESAEMLTLAQTMMLVERLQDAVIAHVTDRSILLNISSEFSRLIGPITSSPINGGEIPDSSG